MRERFHAARADLFIRLLRPTPGATLLDLGGGDGSLAARICERVALDVTVADIETDHRAAVEARGFRYVQLPASGPLPFRDREFDLVLCNSVIEHVTLPKERCRTTARVDPAVWKREARAAQQAFAKEVARVGRSYFVQTPHKHFPIDQHVLLPFVQYLPHNAACRLVSWTDRFWIKSCWGIVDWELFTASSLGALFRGPIHVERFLGLPKSVVAYRRRR